MSDVIELAHDDAQTTRPQPREPRSRCEVQLIDNIRRWRRKRPHTGTHNPHGDVCTDGAKDASTASGGLDAERLDKEHSRGPRGAR
jgi:hypothetical protein